MTDELSNCHIPQASEVSVSCVHMRIRIAVVQLQTDCLVQYMLRNWPLLLFLSIIQESRFFVPGCGPFRFGRERKEQYLEDISLLFFFSPFCCTLSLSSPPLIAQKLCSPTKGGGSPFLSQLQVHCSSFLTNDLICVHAASVSPMACYSECA